MRAGDDTPASDQKENGRDEQVTPVGSAPGRTMSERILASPRS
jgi:hypothetical protein